MHSANTEWPVPSRRDFLALAGVSAALAWSSRGWATTTAARIVCAGGDVTETVALLAGLDGIAGVDTTSRHPEAVRKLPSIGYLRQISVEGILSLRPDLLIAARDLGPPAAVQQLRDAGLRVEIIAAEPDAAGIAAKIRHIGTVLDRAAEAERLAAQVDADMAALATRIAGTDLRPSLAFVHTAKAGAVTVGGRIATVNAAFDLAGGVNAYRDLPPFQSLSREAFLSTPPDFVVLDREVLAAAGGPAGFLDATGFAIGSRAPVPVAADVTILFSFGPSAPQALADLAHRIHPERFGG